MSSKAVAPATERPAEAPGFDIDRDIALVLAFLNTRDIENGTDVLDDVAEWRRWCGEHGLSGAPPDADTARAPREAMRAAVGCASASKALAGLTWPIRVSLASGVPVLVGMDALGTILAAAVRMVHTGHWERLKICPAEDCLWVFYDRSRNRSRTWCSMQVCGNREKARGWRERHTAK